jgi:hypothetical protein
MFQTFSWRGEPIHDIKKWAEEHGGPMVRVRETKRYLSQVTLREHVEVNVIPMPRCFAAGLFAYRGGPGESTQYEVLDE